MTAPIKFSFLYPLGTEGRPLKKPCGACERGVFMPKASTNTKIKKERERLLEIFQDLDANKLSAVQALIDRVAFITVNLQELEADLMVEGWVENYQNGANQNGVKKSAKAEVHISLTKNLNALTKQLLDIVPAAQRKSKLQEMMAK